MPHYRNPITPEDEAEMLNCARRLRSEPDPNVRMRIQIQFVHEMEKKYGHDRAARMLTQVWKIPKERISQ